MPRSNSAPFTAAWCYDSIVDTVSERLARRRRGGRVDAPGDFPDEDAAYRDMTPTERISALRRLSRRAYATKLLTNDGERGHSGLPDRLVGGRR